MHRFATLLRPTQRFVDARLKPRTDLIYFCLVLALFSLCCRGPLGRHLALARAASTTTDVSTQFARSPRRFYIIVALFSRCSRCAPATPRTGIERSHAFPRPPPMHRNRKEKARNYSSSLMPCSRFVLAALSRPHWQAVNTWRGSFGRRQSSTAGRPIPKTHLPHFWLVLAMFSASSRGSIGRQLELVCASSAEAEVSTPLARCP